MTRQINLFGRNIRALAVTWIISLFFGHPAVLNAFCPPDTLLLGGKPLPVWPDHLVFCGETIDLADRDVRERWNDVFLQVVTREDRIAQVLMRAGAYFPYIEKTLQDSGLPADLKYLTVAESSLKIDAYSHAGAAGLWQFIPSTARTWGLTVNTTIDERYHIEKSTLAAIAMLQSLKNEFGSWALAAAAYNAGPGAIRQAIAQQGKEDYANLFLNRETRHYLFHILAVKEIMENPQRYGYRIPSSRIYPPFDQNTRTVLIRGPIRQLGQWIVNYGINYKQLRMLNFWILKDQLPEGEWKLRIPADCLLPDSVGFLLNGSAKNASTNRDTVTRLAVNPIDEDSTLRYIFYTIREADRLSSIAARFNVTVKQIMAWNNLTTDRAVLGAKLKIYYTKSKTITHKVQSGENLYRIAEQYRLSIEQIRRWNKLSGDQIHAGMILQLWVPEE